VEIPDALRTNLAGIDTMIGGFDGKRILEIGGDDKARTLQSVAALYSPKELIGLNPAFASRRIAGNMRVEQVGAQTSGLEDESIDSVFSFSAFEHIRDLGAVLAEMHRVLVPGGLLYSHFGPLWSTSYGHHLWLQHDDGRVFNYHNVLLPPWCHLLSTRDDVRQLVSQYDAGVADQWVDFIFDSTDQNQLFFDDYERIVEDCPLETLFLKGYDAPDLAAKYPTARSPAVLDKLHATFPDRHGFLYDGITLLLRKP
jgi:SAM-dependent methyltransferase